MITAVVFASNISNTRDSVSSDFHNTEKRVENTTRSVEIRGLWKSDETLSRVFDILFLIETKTKKK